MSAEHIAAANASVIPGTPGTKARQPHPFYEGEFLDAVRVAGAAAETTQTRAAQPAPEPHPFYEFELAQTPATANEAATAKLAQAPAQPHPFYEHETADPEGSAGVFGEDGPGLADVLDIINPLQHIPVLSSIYRSVTGDEISPGARLAGGTIYGGPIGLAGAFASGLIEESSDKTIGDMVVAAFTGDDTEVAAAQVAAISPAAGTAPIQTPALPSVADARTAFPTPQSGTLPPPPPPATVSAADIVRATPALPPQLAGNPAAALFGQGGSTPSPLSFARNLMEKPTSAYATPTATATRAVITADEHAKSQNQPELPEGVSAVLTARSQVPQGGSIPGLTTYRRSPNTTSAVETQQVSALPTSNTPKQAAAASGAIVAADGRPAYVPGKRGAPPLRNNTDLHISPRRRAAAVSSVPNSMVPKAMTSALDKYESMIHSRRAPEADADLTM